MKTFSRQSLRSLTVLAAFVLTLMVGALAAFAIHRTLHKAADDEASKLASASASMGAGVIDSDLVERTVDMVAFAALVQETGLWRDRARLGGWMNRIRLSHGGYSWLGMADRDGRIVVGSENLAVGADVSQRDWFRGGLQGVYQGDLHPGKLLQDALPALPGGEPWRFIDISLPVRDAQGEVVGVMAAHLSWPWLRNRLQQVNHALPQGGELWLLGPDNSPRLSPGGDGGKPLALQAIDLARAGRSGAVIETWPDGRRYVTGYAPNPGRDGFSGFGWVTLVRVPADVLPPELLTQWHTVEAMIAAAVVLVTLAAWLASTLWLNPLRLFAERLARLREGQVPPALPARAPREFQELNVAVLRLVDRLEEKEATVRRAMEQLQHSFRSVGSRIPGMLTTAQVTAEGARFLFVSEGSERYFGVLPEELMRDFTAWRRHVDPNDIQALLPRFEQMVASRSLEPLVAPVRVTGADGQVRTLHMSVVPRDHGGAQIYDVISLDVTDLVAARSEAERANRAKSDFLATMSHELRTPLNAILGFAQVLQDALDDPQQRQQARYIRETGETLNRILNDVLDIAKIESGKFDLDPRPFEVAQVIDSCTSIFGTVSAGKGVDFAVDRPGQLPALVGDPVRLRQVLHNLLSNAFKFTAQGQVRLSVQARALEAAPDGRPRTGLRIRVEDTGMGMSPEQLQRLFQRFEQADRSIAGRFGGTGLGLAIVKALVDKMGGTVTVRSREGAGTEFELDIPFLQVEAPAAQAPAAGPDRPEAPLHVLVVDDFHVNRHVLRALLEKRGHRVSEAEDGVQALAQVAQLRPDLVLMDLDMPHMDGLEATRRLRATADEAGALTPVYALTGKAFAEDIERARQAGMDGHLAKPVQMGELVPVLRRVAEHTPRTPQ